MVLFFVCSSCKTKNPLGSDQQMQKEMKDFPALSDPYMGQILPGMEAKVFDPGIFPKGESIGCSGFLNSGTVFVFSSMKPGSNWRIKPTYVMELNNGKWTNPQIAPFSNYNPYNFTVSPDDQTIYFTSLVPPDINSRMLLEQANIWMVALQMNVWTEPVMLGKSINTEQFSENYPAVTENGTIYYMSRREEGVGKTDIYKSEDLGNRFADAENLGQTINTHESDQDPFIAPDESYLILCQDREDGYGKYDLFICYQKEDNSWTSPINMGMEVNSEQYEFRPYVTPDGKYLFFTSNRIDPERGNIFWIDAEIIKKIKPNLK